MLTKEPDVQPEANIQFTLPMDVYDQAAEILGKQGLTVEDAVILLYKYIADTGEIPFHNF